MLNELEKEIRDEILDKLEEDIEIDNNYYDTSFTLWEEESYTGSCTCNACLSTQWIKKHFEDLGKYAEEICNPFTGPEKFQVIMSINITKNILASVWEDNITKDNLIDKLKELN